MDGQGSRAPLQQGAGAGRGAGVVDPSPPAKKKPRRGGDPANQKRRCVSTACVACRKRKSKCDGALPSCAACASVYGTECIYDPNSDHRRKGVYREKVDSMKAQSSTLQILIEAILNAAEDDVPAIVKKIRTCDSLDTVAESILKDDFGDAAEDDDLLDDEDDEAIDQPVEGERDLARKMGELRVENGLVRFFGGTSHLVYLGDPSDVSTEPESDDYLSSEDPIVSWSEVTKDTQLIVHLINMYFAWHYPYFTTLSKSLFYRDFLNGKPGGQRASTYCSSLLVNTMLALGCHFTSLDGAFATPGDSRTKGDHFFAEAKRLIIENDEYEKPRITTVQALALMSVREAGCGREAKGWVYSGMSFRMAQDMGLNLDTGGLAKDKGSLSEQDIDARRITFWGCFLFDKCWSNYLGRLPQLPRRSYNVPKYDVFPNEDAALWSPYTDGGFDQSVQMPSRTRAVGLQLSKLGEISSDLLLFFYHPAHLGRSSGKAVELKKLSELHRRLEDWKIDLPKEFEPREGQLPNVFLMHMFYHLQYIHLFRPFLRYTPSSSPLPAHVSPRRICTANAGAISKLMRLYKKSYNLRQICNIAVYMVHSACTIHMLNLPERTAKRDIIHGVKHLEEIAEDWLCARRTLCILSVLAKKWSVELPEEAAGVLRRADEKYGSFSTSDVPSPNRAAALVTSSPSPLVNSPQAGKQEQYSPLNQFNQPTPPQVAPDLPDPNASPDILGSLTVPSTASQVVQPRLPPTTQISLSDALSWAMPATLTQPLPSFTSQPFTPGTSSGTPITPISATTGAATNTRQVSPSSLYAIDGQEWYLKDGVNWHQTFGTWDLGGAGPGNPGATASPSTNTAPELFMFRGLGRDGSGAAAGAGSGRSDGGEMDMAAAFETFGTMAELDGLPGLD